MQLTACRDQFTAFPHARRLPRAETVAGKPLRWPSHVYTTSPQLGQARRGTPFTRCPSHPLCPLKPNLDACTPSVHASGTRVPLLGAAARTTARTPRVGPAAPAVYYHG